MSEIDPKLLRAAIVSVERDLSIMTGPELIGKYGSGDNRLVFEHILQKDINEVAFDHNESLHFCDIRDPMQAVDHEGFVETGG